MSLLERLRSLFASSSSPAAGDAAASPSAPAAGAQAPEQPPVVTRFLQAGEVVVKEGDPGRSMFVVLEGRVAVARQQAPGAEPVVVGQLGAGEFFGELALLTGAARTATVVAVEDAVVLELSPTASREAWTDYGVESPKLEQAARERLMADAIRSNPLLATLSPELQAQLGAAFVPVTVPAGETLLTRGKPGDALYLLLRGECEVFHTHEDGRHSPLATLKEGALFGEISLLRSRLATATVRTLTPCTLMKLDREVFEKSFLIQPNLRGALVRLGLERLKQTVRVMAEPTRPSDDKDA
ncbi:cyclic nucleotide-binding domain-containing protein [Pyxidicoccus fallax]|uniref:Cyclic nucleotide-binding domain-containing protein n=1 Tax=Pyxidicoccus fallax TaxID=394095 RepID=A0A848LC20_9BACT|nr:cyclic nucleotide-binding domain-containing protein [Pyxidicoccus fallax]NMO16026.1 cyclic nucleotide-binding domain-containing protein [Pyxidicoccus fallax]NPC76961.1 cyclic nucleotide-binding domain-containing protein [Pyxidicoccus fallax]